MSVPRGTTPTFTLTFTDENLDLTAADHVYVSFRCATVYIEKSDEDLDIEAKSVSVYLNQSETLSIAQGKVAIQVNWVYANGDRAASEIVQYSFSGQLLNRVVS